MRSRRITRHLRKAFGSESVEAELAGLSGFTSFLDAIEEQFEHYERRLEMSKRSLELSSKELFERNLQIESLVNSLGEGFLMFDQAGNCLPTCSRICETLFGMNPSGRPIAEVLAIAPDDIEPFNRWCRLLFDEPISFDDLVAAGPRTYDATDARHITLDFKPIRTGEAQAIQCIVVIAVDRTRERDAQLEARRIRGDSERMIRILRHRDEFNEFVLLFRKLTSRLRELAGADHPDSREICGILHTLKGAAASFQLDEIRDEAHAFEGELLDRGAVPQRETGRLTRELGERMEARFNGFLESCRNLLGESVEGSGKTREIPRKAIHELDRLLRRTGAHETVTRAFAESFLTVPIEAPLRRHEILLETAARRLCKEIHPLEIFGGGIRIVPEPYEALLSALAHVFRNALDHGIEPVEERHARGKDPKGKITIDVTQVEDAGRAWLRLQIADDGRGIEPAVLPHVFEPGFSTAGCVTQDSGRGIGLDVVRCEVERMGGRISVSSQPNGGARFEILVPLLNGLGEAASDLRRAA